MVPTSGCSDSRSDPYPEYSAPVHEYSRTHEYSRHLMNEQLAQWRARGVRNGEGTRRGGYQCRERWDQGGTRGENQGTREGVPVTGAR